MEEIYKWKKLKNEHGQYEVSVRTKNDKYYEARISFKLGGGNSPRLQKGGKSTELAVLSLLTALSDYIDVCFKSGVITTKLDDMITQRLMKSINDLGVLTPKISEKTLEIVNKINYINSTILNTFSVPNNVIPFYPPQANIPNAVAPAIAIAPPSNNLENPNTNCNNEICIIEDLIWEWFEYRLSLLVKSDENPKPLSKTTVDRNHTIITTYILPFLTKNKKLYLSQLTEDCIKSLLKSVNGENGKVKTYRVLNMLFKYAIKHNKTTYNPMVKIDKPAETTKTDEEKREIIEPDEQDKWLDIFEKYGTDLCILWETILLTGIRPECACGLKWSALDLENNELIINNAYKSFNIYNEDHTKVIGHYRADDILKTPESYRRIPLNPRLREVLLKHKERQKELFKKSRAIKDRHRKWSENEYMFLGRNYHPYVSDTLSSALPKFCDENNLKRITPYGLRHSFATYCSENGMEEIVLMKLMGHSNYQTTVQYYIRVSAKRKRLAMQEAYKVVFYNRKAS